MVPPGVPQADPLRADGHADTLRLVVHGDGAEVGAGVAVGARTLGAHQLAVHNHAWAGRGRGERERGDVRRDEE